MDITVTFQVDDEYADPDHETGLTEEGYELILDCLDEFPGTLINMRKDQP